MNHIHSDRKRTESSSPEKKTIESHGTSMDALRTGAAQPTAEQMGRRVDLPDAMRTKMESAFGADLGAVKLYESQAVADTGAKAITRGSDIAFAPGMLDFSSFGGQALLGHELSHVVSQARGEVTGGGFLNDRALEARADREGAMAAAGETVAMPTAALSPVTAAAAAGPMQAKDKPGEQPPLPSPVVMLPEMGEDGQVHAPDPTKKADPLPPEPEDAMQTLRAKAKAPEKTLENGYRPMNEDEFEEFMSSEGKELNAPRGSRKYEKAFSKARRDKKHWISERSAQQNLDVSDALPEGSFQASLQDTIQQQQAMIQQLQAQLQQKDEMIRMLMSGGAGMGMPF